jgi:hypothetical protein
LTSAAAGFCIISARASKSLPLDAAQLLLGGNWYVFQLTECWGCRKEKQAERGQVRLDFVKTHEYILAEQNKLAKVLR